MKIFKKSLLTIQLLVVMLFSVVALSACGKSMTFSINDNINKSVEKTISVLNINAYNNKDLLGTQTTYSAKEIENKISDLEYYVNVGKISNAKSVDKISLNDETFKSNQTFNLSIGNSNFISDKCFYVQDNNLYVAAPILAVESLSLEKIKINDTAFDYTQSTKASELKFTNVSFLSSSKNTVEKVEGSENEYNVNIKDGTTYLCFYYADALSTDYAITKKVFTTDGKTSVSYGFTKVENIENYPVALYPIGWKPSYDGTDAYYNDTTVLNYTIYMPSKGVAEVVLNYELLSPDAE